LADYLLSFFYKARSGSRGKLQIYGISDSSTIFDSGWLDATDWQKYASCLVLSEAYGAKVIIEDNGDEFIIDNLSILQSLIADGGFESGADWLTSNCTFSIDSSNERTGDYTGKATASADGGYLYQTATVVDGSVLTASFWGKGSAAGHQFKFQIVGVTTATTYYDSGWIDSTTYINKMATFRVSGDTSLTIKGMVETSGEIAYFDDWSMIPLVVASPTIQDGAAEIDSYETGRWSEADGSLVINGGDTLKYVSSGRIRWDVGSFGVHNYFYLGATSITDDQYFLEMTNLFRLYFKASDNKFYFQVYNGADWTTCSIASAAQTFSVGWKHIIVTWDNTDGVSLYIDAALAGYTACTWTDPGSMDTYFYAGSKDDGTSQCDGKLDDVVIYNNCLSTTRITELFTE